jgi:hypothetical protein
MSKIKKNINAYTEEIENSIFKDLCFIFSIYGSVKNCVYSRYSSICSYNKVHDHNKQIRDAWTKEGRLDLFGIPKRYVRMAIDDSIGNIKTMWVLNCSTLI